MPLLVSARLEKTHLYCAARDLPSLGVVCFQAGVKCGSYDVGVLDLVRYFANLSESCLCCSVPGYLRSGVFDFPHVNVGIHFANFTIPAPHYGFTINLCLGKFISKPIFRRATSCSLTIASISPVLLR